MEISDITPTIQGFLSQGWIMFLLGIIAHFFKKMYEEGGDSPVSFNEYFAKRPWRSGLVVIGGTVAFVTAGVVDPTASFLLGYTADSAASKLNK